MQEFRFTYTHEVEGSIVGSELDGWIAAMMGWERMPIDKGGSLVEFYKSTFGAYGDNGSENGQRDWFKMIERVYGPDATITVLTEMDEGEGFEFLSRNTIPIFLFVETLDLDHMLDMSFSQESAWIQFINRIDTPIDIQSETDEAGNAVDVIPPRTIPLTGQKVNMRYRSEEVNGTILIVTEDYYQYQPYNEILAEVKKTYQIDRAPNTTRPVWIFQPELKGETEFDFRIEYSLTKVTAPGQGHNTPRTIYDWWFQLNDDAPIEFSYAAGNYTDPAVYDNWDFPVAVPPVDNHIDTAIATFTQTMDLQPGDRIRVFMLRDTPTDNNLTIWGIEGLFHDKISTVALRSPRPDGMTDIPTYFQILQRTEFPDTEVPGFPTHDVADAILTRLGSGRLLSPFLGGPLTSVPYTLEGCGYPLVNVPGLQLRGYTLTEKPFFISWKDWWSGINPILCLGFGYDNTGRIEVKPLREFFDSSSMSILLSNVQKIQRRYDQDHYFNLFKYGYNKGTDPEDISGLNIPHGERKRSSIFKNIAKTFEFISTWIAGDLAIEITRRKGVVKSADFKYDDDVFVIACLANEYGFTPELSENFTDVTGLDNEETRYNKRLWPVRNFVRWLDYLSSGLQSYLTSVFAFKGGDGNYDVAATMDADGCDGDFEGEPLTEKQNIQVSPNKLFTPKAFEIFHVMTWAQYKAIRANKNLAIGISQTDSGHVPAFIKDLQWEVTSGDVKIIVWFLDDFDINPVESAPPIPENVGHYFDDFFALEFE